MRAMVSICLAAGLAACTVSGGETAVEATQPPSKADAACVAEVQKVTSAREPVTVLSSDFSEAATVVMLNVPGATAPWYCRASNDGVVEETYFTGSEGAL